MRCFVVCAAPTTVPASLSQSCTLLLPLARLTRIAADRLWARREERCIKHSLTSPRHRHRPPSLVTARTVHPPARITPAATLPSLSPLLSHNLRLASLSL